MSLFTFVFGCVGRCAAHDDLPLLLRAILFSRTDFAGDHFLLSLLSLWFVVNKTPADVDEDGKFGRLSCSG